VSAGGLEWCGLTLDPVANAAAAGGDRRISTADARLAAFVIATDEEMEIARGTVEALHAAPPRDDSTGGTRYG
jgi:acetate kinase